MQSNPTFEHFALRGFQETKAKTPRSLMKINTAKKTDSSDRKKSKFKRKYFEVIVKYYREVTVTRYDYRTISDEKYNIYSA